MKNLLWIDASAGASGDMLLAALWDVGVPAAVMSAAAAAVAPVELSFSREQRHGFEVARAQVRSLEPDPTHRSWASIRATIESAQLDEIVRELALRTFTRLAEAEAAVHGVPAADIHFHEVGAYDSIGDILGVCAGFGWLGVRPDAEGTQVRVGPIALGGGSVDSAHGVLPIPGPAVVQLLHGSSATATGGPVPFELCTPTGAALLLSLAHSFGDLPLITLEDSGFGCGTRVLQDRLGALRILRGTTAKVEIPRQVPAPNTVLETNVDDLDPRLWPQVLQQLLEAGAADAWLTPILMKKGRPAHTLHVLAATTPSLIARLKQIIFSETTAIGLRQTKVTKTALDREFTQVDVSGHRISIKHARLDGEIINSQPEFDEVAAAASALGRPVKQVLAEAIAASNRA